MSDLPKKSPNATDVTFVYQLSFDHRKKLAAILDPKSLWQTLAARMKFSADDVLEFRHITQNGRSPTELILDVWSSRLHTVDNLALLLAKIGAFSAVDVVSTLVKQETTDQIDAIKEKFQADQAASKVKMADIKIGENRVHINSSNEQRYNDRADLRRPSLPNELSKKCRVGNSPPVKKPSKSEGDLVF